MTNQKTRIYNLLKERGEAGVTNAEFVRNLGIFRYGARIKELRDEGQNIRSIKLKGGLWKFVLVPKVEVKETKGQQAQLL